MTYAEYEKTEGRIEFWDSLSETAFEAREPLGVAHEARSRGLTTLIRRIDLARGASCGFLGGADLRMRVPGTGRMRTMQPDESVYLSAERVAGIIGSGGHPDWVQVEEGELPDVVLEVDHTTDVRRGKLKQYELWGAPEVWVEVPDRITYSRPRGLKPGLTIHLLEGGRYRESPVSRAFPGWRAEEIHRGLNEVTLSRATIGALERVGKALGARHGTSAEDDLQTRRLLEAARRETRAATRLEQLRLVLRLRGIQPDPRLGDSLTEDDRRRLVLASEESIYEAIRAAADEADFFRRLRGDPSDC